MDATRIPPTDDGTPTGGDGPAMARRPRVMVLFGGRSGEHAISCATAGGVLRAIDRSRYDVVAVGITRTGQWVLADDDPDHWAIRGGRLPEVEDTSTHVLLPQGTADRDVQVLRDGRLEPPLEAVDVVFPLLHGPFGEDGTLQGLLELADVRYVGSGVLASAVGMDKHMMKLVLAGSGLRIGPFRVLPAGRTVDAQTVDTLVAELGLPLFVKPARAGSSLGITRVQDPAELPAAIAAAREHDPKVIVEAALVGREIECGVLEAEDGGTPDVSFPAEVHVADGFDFYDFEAKYLSTSGLTIPAEIPEEAIARLRAMAADVFEAMGCEGLARVDFFYTENGEILVNELNTMPGFTPSSAFPQMWAATGVDYVELIERMITTALRRDPGLR